MRSVSEELRRAFGRKEEGATTTGMVMNLPSGVTREQALKCVSDVPMESVLRDLAVVLARELAAEMHTHGLRPADYAMDEKLPSIIVERLIQELKTVPEVFERTLREHMKLKG